jgi:hypothetical protein
MAHPFLLNIHFGGMAIRQNNHYLKEVHFFRSIGPGCIAPLNNISLVSIRVLLPDGRIHPDAAYAGE